jgi:chromosome segregation ATPase
LLPRDIVKTTVSLQNNKPTIREQTTIRIRLHMPSHTRRVYWADEIRVPDIDVQRTRGPSRVRTRSADRVHTIVDDLDDMRDRGSTVSRELYDELQRQNQYLRIELRELQSVQAWAQQLELEKAELVRENRELRRSADYTSDNEARKESKLHRLRKKYAKLEAEVAELKDKLAEWKTKATDWKTKYEDIRRREEDAQRRIDIYRENMNLMEQENAALKRSLERRRYY